MMMPCRRLIVVPLMIATVLTGCSSRDSSRDSERDRNDQAFTVQDSSDWGDATGRVINHLLGVAPPRGGIWPAQENQ